MTWAEFFTIVESYGPVSVTIILIIAALSLIIKAWPTITKIVNVANEVADLPETLQTLTTEIKVIRQEVLPNGGSSLRDAVNRTENQIQLISQIVAQHEEQIRHVIKSPSKKP